MLMIRDHYRSLEWSPSGPWCLVKPPWIQEIQSWTGLVKRCFQTVSAAHKDKEETSTVLERPQLVFPPTKSLSLVLKTKLSLERPQCLLCPVSCLPPLIKRLLFAPSLVAPLFSLQLCLLYSFLLSVLRCPHRFTLCSCLIFINIPHLDKFLNSHGISCRLYATLPKFISASLKPIPR